MSSTAAPTTYGLREVQRLLGVSRGVVTGLVEAGFVAPERGPRNEWRFSFQDLMLLRTAHALRAAQVPPRRIVSALRKLRAALPDALPMTGLRITAQGSEVAVRDQLGHWAPESGQALLDFEVAPVDGGLAFLTPPGEADDAQTWFARGEALETADPPGAEAAYRQALERAPDHIDTLLNLGAMLCEAGRCSDAVALYDRAVQLCPEAAHVHFNHAIALEDQGDLDGAVGAYGRCLALDPALADAHFNLARLHERQGRPQAALRHFNAYRRLQGRPLPEAVLADR